MLQYITVISYIISLDPAQNCVMGKFNKAVQKVARRALFLEREGTFSHHIFKSANNFRKSILFKLAIEELQKSPTESSVTTSIVSLERSIVLATLDPNPIPAVLSINRNSRCFADDYEWQYFLDAKESRELLDALILAGAVALERAPISLTT